MDPNQAVHVPERQDVAGEFVYPLTTAHVRKFGIPFVALFLLSIALPLSGSATLLCVAGAAGVSILAAFLHIQGVPLDRWLRNQWHYHATNRRYSSRPNTPGAAPSRDFVRVSNLEGGVIVSRDSGGYGTYAIVCRVTPPNYALLREEEKTAALDAFGSLLSSSELNLQVLSRAQPYDLEGYFRGFRNALAAQKRRSLQDLVVQFLTWFEDFGRRHRVLHREYFLILSQRAPAPAPGQVLAPPQQEARERTLRALHSGVQNVRHQLTAAGAVADVLGNAQALALVQAGLNPRTFSQESQLRQAWTTSPASLEGPGQLRVPDVTVHPDCVRVGNDWVRTLVLKQYPDRLPVAWLFDLLVMDQRLGVSLHYEPKPAHRVLKRLKQSKITLRQNIHGKEKKGFDATEDRQLLEALEDQIRAVAGRQTNYFEVTACVSVHATSRALLDQATQQVESKLRNLSLTPFLERYTQRDAFESTLPLGINRIGQYSQTMDTACATATYPFLTSSIHHDAGTLLGMHSQTGSPYLVDRWRFLNHNRIVAGTSGAGKSFSIKLDMERTLLRRPDAWLFVIDPLREFTDITRALGGQVVYVGNARTVLNPFDLGAALGGPEGGVVEENALHAKLGFLETLFQILLPGLSRLELSILKLAIQNLYRGCGITNDPKTHTRPAPILGDLVAALAKDAEGLADAETRHVSKNLHTYLLPLLHGPMACLNGPTNVRTHAQVLTFDLQSLDADYFPAFMFIVLDLIERRVVSDVARPKVIYIDESWRLLQEACTAKPLSQLSRHVRHYRCGIDFITQTPDSFFANEHGQAIHSNCLQALIFRQKSVSEQTRKGFGLTVEEAAFLTRLGKAENMDHSEALLVTGDDKAYVAIYSSPHEYALITTKPEDLAARQRSAPTPTAHAAVPA